jgi:hypothetical protein
MPKVMSCVAMACRYGIERAQDALRRLRRVPLTDHAEHVAAIGDLHPKAQFQLAQVFVEGTVEIGQAFVVLGFEDEIALWEGAHWRKA